MASRLLPDWKACVPRLKKNTKLKFAYSGFFHDAQQLEQLVTTVAPRWSAVAAVGAIAAVTLTAPSIVSTSLETKLK